MKWISMSEEIYPDDKGDASFVFLEMPVAINAYPKRLRNSFIKPGVNRNNVKFIRENEKDEKGLIFTIGFFFISSSGNPEDQNYDNPNGG